MDEEGVMKTEDNSLLVLIGLGVENLPAIEASEKLTQSEREGGRVL